MEQTNQEIDDDLNYSYVEQCHNQIFKLNQEILAYELDKNDKVKYATYHRLFKYNVFEYIEPKKRQYLDRVLIRILSSLGNHISKNLMRISNENQTTTARSPTPASFSSNRSCSSNSNSISISTSYLGPITRSTSSVSENLEPTSQPEIIIVSSDEEEDEFGSKRIKTSDTNDSEIIIKQEKSFDGDLTESRSVNLQDITSSFNTRISTIDNEGQDQESQDSCGFSSQTSTKWPANSLLMVNTKDLSNYSYDKYGVIGLKPKKDIKYTAVGRKKQAILLHVIAKLLSLIENGTYISKRELYYLSLKFCQTNKKPGTQSSTQSSGIGTQSQSTSTQSSKSQSPKKMDSRKIFKALDDLCCLVGCSKVHLHVLSQSKGLIYGNLIFKLKDGECYNCLDNKEGTHLPTSQIPIAEISSDAKFVLILEKDSVFQKMLSNEHITRFVESYKVILFTARGYPDVTSRAFVKYLWTTLKIPILALTDADPHGIEIACSFKFGVYTTAYESTYTCVPQTKWLGFFPSEIKRLSIPETKIVQLTETDLKKLDSLSLRPYLKVKKDWMNEINLLKESGIKAELEALDKDGTYLIETYLPNKLRFASWI